MDSILIIGIIILTGFVFGELATRIRLPRITGYIIAGILLGLRFRSVLPQDFSEATSLVIDICLSIITFAIGGALYFKEIRAQGKQITYITLFQAETTFVVVFLGLLLTIPFVTHSAGGPELPALSVCVILGALALPTDPAAVLAVSRECKARGEVTATVLGVAALDDVLTFLNYAIAVQIAGFFISGAGSGVVVALARTIGLLVAALGLGAAFGLVFNLIAKLTEREGEGVLIVELIGLLSLCFGVARFIGLDELLSTMAMGIVVVNLNPLRDKVFRILERYTEELVFVLFFTLSGMHLDFSVVKIAAVPIVLFVVLRSIGKLTGTVAGATLARSSRKIRRYTGGALIPQGGIVIGLALILKHNDAFAPISDIILSVVIGATVIHELIGPLLVRLALQRAGELGDR